MTADEAMQAGGSPKGAPALDFAKDWLRTTLASGELKAEDVFERAKGEGIAKTTLQRASRELDVRKVKAGMTEGWSWSLPTKVAKSTEDVQASDAATFEGVGYLQESADGMAEVEL